MVRALLLLAAFVAAAASPLLYRSSAIGKSVAWGLLAAALCLGAAGCWRLSLPGTALDGPSGPATPRRRRLGLGLALAGIALWIWAPWVLLSDWNTWFTPGWLAWVGGTILLGAGLDQAWARWQWPARPGLRLGIVVGAMGAVAALYRFGTFYFFPAESHITQIEELQVGAMGSAYLRGWRQRWEYLSHAWLAAIGLWLGGPSLFAMRAPFAAVSVLKVVPLFLWLRFSAGNAAAVVGTALLAFSAWDVTYARVPTNQNAIVIAAAFALLAGPARRGRPSAYVWLGLLGGYVLYEYVGYRLVGLFAIAGGLVASLRHASDPWWARLGRPLLTMALIAVMGSTLYLHLTRTGQMHQYYDGWGRARANQTHYNAADSPMERLERIGLFTDTNELDRLAGDRPHRQCSTTARVTVGLGQHHAGQGQRLAERLGGVDGVLTGHRINDEQRLGRLQLGVQRTDLGHHLLIDCQTAGGIHQQHVGKLRVGLAHSPARNVERQLGGGRFDEVGTDFTGERAQLFDSGRPIDVGTDHRHLLAMALFQKPRKLADRGRLARPLKTGHQDDHRRFGGQLQGVIRCAHHLHQLLVHDLHECLARIQGGIDLLAERSLLHLLDEVLDDRERHVGLEQRHANFAQRIADVLFGESCFTRETTEGLSEFFRKTVEHHPFQCAAAGIIALHAQGALCETRSQLDRHPKRTAWQFIDGFDPSRLRNRCRCRCRSDLRADRDADAA